MSNDPSPLLVPSRKNGFGFVLVHDELSGNYVAITAKAVPREKRNLLLMRLP